MNEFLWAISSALFVMLIVNFLPLGLAEKGKFLLVGISFLLALTGVAASASFSFLITVLILVVLILFVTYLLDQRLGKLFYNIDDSADTVENEDSFMNANMQTAASHESVYQRKNKAAVELINLLNEEALSEIEEITKTDSVGITESEAKQSEKEKEIQVFESGDEDVSFLFNRTIPLEEENNKKPEEPESKNVAYLAEIEKLLDGDLAPLQKIYISKPSQSTAAVAENEHEIPVISFDDKPLKKSNETNSKSARKIEESNSSFSRKGG